MEKDLGALQWVADELGQVSDELVRTLLGFADDPSDSTRLRSGLTGAHQIHATLRLLAVPSAERLADEIEQTLQALLNAELAPSSDALQTLLAAVMELPAYLRRVGTERRESPHDVLMVLNDLRALRGAAPLPPPPAELSFALDALHRDTGEQAPSASPEEMQLLRLARQRFQAELLGVLRRDASAQRLGQLVRVFALLAQRLGSTGHRLFWETAAAWVNALECAGVEPDEQALALLRELDGELRAGIALEAGCYRRAPDVQTCTRLLAGLAASAPVSERVVEVQRRHRLLAAAATRYDLGAVAAAIVALTDELGSVLQRLESTEGDAMANARTLREVEPELRRIAQLLAGLGFQDEQHLLQTQIERMAAGFTPGPGLDDQITAVSAALLDLDQRLATRAVAAGGGGAVANRRHPLQRALEAVCREVGNALERVKQTVTDYLSSYGGVSVLSGLPDELHRLAGALQVAGLDAAADVLQGCRDHLVAIQTDEGARPGAAVIDTLADALGAVEYFLERFLIDGYASDLILVRAAATLHGGGAEPVEPALTTDELLSLVSLAPAEPATIAAGPIEVQAPSPVPTPVTTQVIAAPDPEIVEVFVEEATEVLATISEQLPQWSVAPEPGSALTELRRAFHTLKGSGRMVGADLIGELSWSAENLLNRVIDGTLAVTPVLVAAVAACRALLPDLVTAFAQGVEGQRDAVTPLRRRLDALARGEEPPAEVPVPPAPAPVAVPSEPVPEPVGVGDVEQEAGERLRTIFGEELAEHLHALRAYLGVAEPAVVNQSLLRTLHTLRGSSCAAGNDTLALVLEPLDDMVHAAGEAAQALTAGQLALLTQLCDLLDHALSEPADTLGLEARAQALRAGIDDVFPRAARAAHPDARLVRFLHEALEKLFHAGSLLEAWRAGHDTAAGGHALLDELRAVHERAAQLGVTGVLRLARPMLDALEPAVLGGVGPSVELFGALGAACEACLDVLDRLAAGELPETPAAIIERLAAVTRTPAAPVIAEPPLFDDTPDVAQERMQRDLQHAEAELLGIFLEEAEELMLAIDESIDAWRHDRGNRAPFDDLQRHVHTLKGGARMAGLKYFGELAHHFETLLINEALRFGRFDDAFFARVAEFHERLLRAMDAIREQPAVAVQPPPRAPEPEVPSVVAVAFEAQEPVEPVGESVASVTEPVAASAEVTETVISVPPFVAATPAAAPKPRDEVVRVSAQLLEELVNLAGEASISRARVEEQVNELGQLFDDMQGAIERVQGQVRRLDIATEAQVLFRRERADGSSAEGFDPLEMDRYSQLQQLSRSLVESASDLLDIKRTLAEKTRDLETVLVQQGRLNGQLQEGLMRSRMVPFSSVVPRLKRLVRQVAGELGKDVELVVGNVGGDLDRGILERVMAPLEHMLRNAVDHGIEAAARRRERNKPTTGQIHIDVARDGGDVVIVVADDGGGVDLAAVRSKAIERGLLDPVAQLRDHDVLQFILPPGFSTATAVTQISGRGVGMDVVSSEIRQMGGSLEIDSRPAEGTRFVVRLPFTVSVNRALLVGVGQETYALPLNTVAGVVRLRVDELAQYAADERLLEYAGQGYRVRYLGAVLHPDEHRDLGIDGDTVPLVLVRGGGQALAVEVDRLLGARDIAVKSLGPQFGTVPGLSGATVLGDGSVVLILDLPAMLRADAASGFTAYERGTRVLAPRHGERPPRVMVVDDSVTVRKVTTRFLEREGMQVVTAKDGAEAMLKLQEQVPDVMLLDIEMPHMDGFEVISKVRLSDVLRDLPIVMITSRTGDKHRERAFALGANAYLGKPYQESVLLEQIRALLAPKEVTA